MNNINSVNNSNDFQNKLSAFKNNITAQIVNAPPPLTNFRLIPQSKQIISNENPLA